MKQISGELFKIVKTLKDDLSDIILPPENGMIAIGQSVIPKGLFLVTRSYLEKVAHQINGCYDNGWYDACSVMLRRFIETLIIEVFEAHNISDKIKNGDGDFYYLSDLITKMMGEQSWNLTRNTKRSLPKLKDLGDKSAHNRRFNALRNDIDILIPDIRVVTQEFLVLAKIK
jgi:hypothetical protein